MTREIKFRAWDEKENRMIEYPDIVVYCNPDGIFTYGTKSFNSHRTLMQFIGIKDKNGKDIYEGDIVGKYLDENNAVWIKKDTYNEEDASICFERGEEDYLNKFYNKKPLEVLVYVKYNDGEAGFGLYEKFLNNIDEDYEEDWHDESEFTLDSECEVIGNIYQLIK